MSFSSWSVGLSRARGRERPTLLFQSKKRCPHAARVAHGFWQAGHAVPTQIGFNTLRPQKRLVNRMDDGRGVTDVKNVEKDILESEQEATCCP